MNSKKGVIGILTGGGDVPGLNPAIRAITIRAVREGFRVIGIRKGWEGLIRLDRNRSLEEQEFCQVLTGEVVNKVGRTGGTFLHTSRTRPSHIKKRDVPEALADQYTNDTNDLTPEVLKNLEYLGIDYLIPIGHWTTNEADHRPRAAPPRPRFRRGQQRRGERRVLGARRRCGGGGHAARASAALPGR